MLRSKVLCGWAFALALVMMVGAFGCNKTSAPPDAATGNADQAVGDQAGPDQHDHAMDSGDSKIAEALAALSPADRAAAEKQKVCPVSGETLGAMGTPKKVLVKGREVFICCDGCRRALEDDPDKYLAKLAP